MARGPSRSPVSLAPEDAIKERRISGKRGYRETLDRTFQRYEIGMIRWRRRPPSEGRFPCALCDEDAIFLVRVQEKGPPFMRMNLPVCLNHAAAVRKGAGIRKVLPQLERRWREVRDRARTKIESVQERRKRQKRHTHSLNRAIEQLDERAVDNWIARFERDQKLEERRKELREKAAQVEYRWRRRQNRAERRVQQAQAEARREARKVERGS